MHLVAVIDVHGYLTAVRESAKQKLIGERSAYRVLNQPRHRPRTHQRVEARLREMLFQRRRERDLDFFLVQLVLELHQEFVDNAQDDVFVECLERNDGVETVAELGREQAPDL